MRMKEVCERTGLTDRAVRLYIESGLVSPDTEHNYAGRRTIIFNEEDIKKLEAVAILRRADFSISDIGEMQTCPESISDIVIRHREAMEREVKNKMDIIDSLDACVQSDFADYFDVASLIRSSASKNNIPKEDSGMNRRDIRNLVLRRVSVIFALAFFVVGLINIFNHAIKTSFADVGLKSGGGYEYTFNYSFEGIADHIIMFGAVLALLLAVIVTVIYFVMRKKNWLLFAVCFGVLAMALLLFIPGADAERMYFFEFLTARSIFIGTPLYNTGESFEAFVKICKYLPILIGSALSLVGYFLGDLKEK